MKRKNNLKFAYFSMIKYEIYCISKLKIRHFTIHMPILLNITIVNRILIFVKYVESVYIYVHCTSTYIFTFILYKYLLPAASFRRKAVPLGPA